MSKYKDAGISRQLIIAMGSVNLMVTILSMLIGSLVYHFAIRYGLVSQADYFSDSFFFHYVDLIFFFSVFFIGAVVATYLGIRLARRFIKPINSLASVAQKISRGDLSVRVNDIDEKSFAEISQLVHDFNLMAEKLEVSVKNAQVWNAAIAHELRTPVTILQGRLQGVVDGVFEPNVNLCQNLLTQVEGLSHLVEDLRTLSLVENQQLRLNLRLDNLKEMIYKCLAAFQNRLDHAKLIVHLELTDIPVLCDVQRMQQILMALLENEIRYAQSGQLLIRTQQLKSVWTLTIEDQGPGIPTENIPYIFQPFYRIEDSRNRSQGGTGLGLSVVFAIVSAHQGQVKYQVNQQGGSCFMIELPLG